MMEGRTDGRSGGGGWTFDVEIIAVLFDAVIERIVVSGER
jgi:hypothetical protein